MQAAPGCAVQREGWRCSGGKDASPPLCRRPESSDSLQGPRSPSSGVSSPTSTGPCGVPSQADWRGPLRGRFASVPLYPARDSRPGINHGGAEWPRAPCFKRCTCHMVINGCGISFDRNSMAWNRLCASLLCLRQSAY